MRFEHLFDVAHEETLVGSVKGSHLDSAPRVPRQPQLRWRAGENIQNKFCSLRG